MKYFDIFRTSDRNEISIIKNLFNDEDINYRTYGEATDSAANIGALGTNGLRIKVAEGDRVKAAKIIQSTGLLGETNKDSNSHIRMSQKEKWLLIAAIFILLLILFILIRGF